jgi:ABC-type branched-subunit amino acid transport system ATPase component/ABC-type branched-subunit amino acid transport system permease subunit
MSFSKKTLNVFLYLAILVLIFVYPFIVKNPFFFWETMLICIIGMVTMGLNVLTGYTGLISLGQAGLYAVGAYTGALLGVKLGMSFFPALILSTLFAAGIGALLAYPTIRVSGVYFAMVTIAFGLVIENILIEWHSLTKGPVGIDGIPPVQIGSFKFKEQHYFYLIALSFFACIILIKNLIQSKYGRSFKAVGMSQIGAETSGINALAMRSLAFIFSAAWAGAAGHYFAYLNLYLSPEIFQFDTSILFLVIIIFGGLGTILGPIVGTGILVILPEILQRFADYRLIVYGCLILILLYFMPMGLVGWLNQFLRRIRPNLLTARDDFIEGKTEIRLSEALLTRGGLTIPGESEVAGDGFLLESKSITKRFGGLVAVDGLSIGIKSNTIHALIGPNGAGKTTLINIISGIYQPTEGEVYFRREKVDNLSPSMISRKGIGRTFQTTQLFGDMTVCENVMTGFYPHIHYGLIRSFLQTYSMRKEENEIRERALELLNFVGYKGKSEELARNLPFGHQRLVEVARALALNPYLLLMDEPAAGLTGREVKDLDNLINNIRKYNISVLLIEHHVDLVMSLSDTITVLDYGRKISEGNPETVRNDPAVIRAYLGSSIQK